ncbi:NADP-dependent oxidoreductase [Gordonia metallireducens]|uniref:NADP-dependent oxidoreductase n=1 Tax=Gordonia metallireducens TaxID=2897779 RepID=UPI001E476AC0|nr:NADP-dependent oxidoreductase [Gordonia metallireducens]
MISSTQVVTLARRPRGPLRPGDLAITEQVLPPLRTGDVLVRNTWLSVDPSIRIRLAETTPDGYLPPFTLGESLAGLALGVVVDSRSGDFEVGQHVSHLCGFREHAVVRADGATLGGYGGLSVVDTLDHPPQWFLGPLGSSGLTAYAGVHAVLDVKPTDTVWVSAAAGAVGGLVAQLSRLRGATVVGSAGSPAKVEYLREQLGLDAAFDHHRASLTDRLAEAAPAGITAYFDSVGGDHLEAALDAMNPGGRVAVCGAIAAYDAETPPPGPRNLFQLVSKSITVQGYRAGSYNDLLPAMQREIGEHLAQGRMHYEETVFDGLESAPAALAAMLEGLTTGKTLVRLDENRS